MIEHIAQFLGGWKVLNPLGILLLSISVWFLSMAFYNLALRNRRGGDRHREDK